MHQIIIIGTVPPCPRCHLMTELVSYKVNEMGLSAQVRHISFKSEEAAVLAGIFGMTSGTAKDVASLLKKDINMEEMPKKANEDELRFVKDLQPELKLLESSFREVSILDNWLRPFENQARELGVLMTPTLIINGVVKHSGSVPKIDLIEKWLSELNNNSAN